MSTAPSSLTIQKRATAGSHNALETPGPENSFRCPVCGNGYEKLKTRDRHVPYCQKKATAPPPPRQSSCLSCITGKARCDRKRPSCSRCQMRRKQCTYTAGKLASRRIISPPHSESGNEESHNLSPEVVYYSKETQIQLVERDSASNWALSSSNQYSAPESSTDLGAGLTSFDAVGEFSVDNSWIEDYFTGTRKRNVRSSPFNFDAGLSPFWSRQEPRDFDFTPHSAYVTDLSTLQPKLPRSLLRRTLTSPVASANGQFILQTLRTYPRMMLRRDTYPPLVHASSHNDQTAISSIEDPISVCTNTIQLFYSKTSQSSPFVWRAIRFEQERLYNQCGNFDKWKLLGAAQSIMLYILLRIIDGPTDENNFEMALIWTLERVFSFLHMIRPAYGTVLRRETAKPDWKDWVFAESANRIVIIYYLLHLFLEIEDSCPDYDRIVRGAPVPCKKVVWEAKDSDSWNLEYDSDFYEQESDPLMTCGRVADLHHQAKSDSSVQGMLDALYADVDGLGHLVLLSAALS